MATSKKTVAKNQKLVLTSLFVNNNRAPQAKKPYTFNGVVQPAGPDGKPKGYVSSTYNANGKASHYQKLSPKAVTDLFNAEGRKLPSEEALSNAVASRKPLISPYFKGRETRPLNFKADIEVKNGFRMMDPDSIRARARATAKLTTKPNAMPAKSKDDAKNANAELFDNLTDALNKKPDAPHVSPDAQEPEF